MKFKACELHTHTVNSDGTMSLEVLAKGAKEANLDCFALTDHNTTAGHLDIKEVSESVGIDIVKGMEWITFYGHVVVLGTAKYTDWRDIGQYDFNKGLDRIHQKGALAGIAHPFRLGYPISTGTWFCYKDFDWDKVDYMEVWSRETPTMNKANALALEHWEKLLNEGKHVTGVCGRDWHHIETVNMPIPATYVAEICKGNINDVIKAGIKSGKVIGSMGPLVYIEACLADGRVKGMGETLTIEDQSGCQFNVVMEDKAYGEESGLNQQALTLQFRSNKGTLTSNKQQVGTTVYYSLNLEGVKWVRLDVKGEIKGEICMVGFTNPIFLEGT